MNIPTPAIISVSALLSLAITGLALWVRRLRKEHADITNQMIKIRACRDRYDDIINEQFEALAEKNRALDAWVKESCAQGMQMAKMSIDHQSVIDSILRESNEQHAKADRANTEQLKIEARLRAENEVLRERLKAGKKTKPTKTK